MPFKASPVCKSLPSEKIRLPLKSRDDLPPILAGLQWVWMNPTLRAEFFALLEAKVLAGKKLTGRTGMDLWQILVLGVVRLGLDADWDWLEDMANHHLRAPTARRARHRELLSLYVPTVVMPKRGQKNTAETEHESGKKLVALRH